MYARPNRITVTLIELLATTIIIALQISSFFDKKVIVKRILQALIAVGDFTFFTLCPYGFDNALDYTIMFFTFAFYKFI
jgi:hypothetical protein